MRVLAVLRFIRHSTLLLGVGLVGGVVTAAGVVMLVTPGPGLLVIIAGLAILSTQFAWAERALDKAKQRAIAARDKAVLRRADRRAAKAAGATGSAASDTEPRAHPRQAAGSETQTG
ncbi:MAG TPA: PGPGW domain-containing protein [Acidimicrobiales bacterium]|nr:PGPGW domain-containing protein [Acidimicrobiales bacterium]